MRLRLLAAIAIAAFPVPGVADELSQAMQEFAVLYAAAWCSQEPAQVAAFHAEDGMLVINGGAPSSGRPAIAEAAGSFMTAYPDMVVELESLERVGDRYRFHWKFTGTNSGPGGTGRSVHMRGYEEWTMGTDGLIAQSLGHYDQAEWDRQLGQTSDPP